MRFMNLLFQKKNFVIFLLGVSSGLPLALTSSTLTIWLSRLNIDITLIGLVSLCNIPYSIKFFWAFIFDYFKLGKFGKKFGQRVSWIILIQICLILFIIALGFSNPVANFTITLLFAFLVVFFSASQDILIDAFRIEYVEENEQSIAATMITYGYRTGMLISGTLPLITSIYFGWEISYLLISLFILPGSFAAIFAGRKLKEFNKEKPNLKKQFLGPLIEFTSRNQWLLIILFVVSYKFSDSLLSTMASKLYVEVGFTNIEIASVVKTFGFIMTLFGTFLSALLTFRFGIFRVLLICTILQPLSNLIYLLLVYGGHNLYSLYAVITMENISSALSGVAMVTYLSNLCSKKFVASQYAILSALASIGRTFISSSSGYLVKYHGWTDFFILTVIAGIPAVIFCIMLSSQNKINQYGQ